jgi:type II secretory pathway component PulJ
MKKLIVLMAAASMLPFAAPVAAQSSSDSYRNWSGGYANGDVSARINELQARIQAGVRTGAITRQEAIPLRQQLRTLTQLERQYSVNGLSGRERADLQRRINILRQHIRYADGGSMGYGDDRYSQGNGMYDRNNDGWDDRDANRDGRWDVDSRYDRNRDGWDDRDLDRDGRWDDDRSYDTNGDRWGNRDDDRDGRWDSDSRNDYDRGSWDDRDGRWNDDQASGYSSLRVGQRVTSGLYAVPYQYQNQYRDGSGVYYRSDGRTIYQIDARTNIVLRAYDMNR